HKALVAVEQALVVEIDEHLDDGSGEALIHGEALAAPVARRAEAAQLLEDGSAGFFLPAPHALKELLAAEIGTLLALRVQLALDHHLGGDARVVSARLPEHIVPLET